MQNQHATPKAVHASAPAAPAMPYPLSRHIEHKPAPDSIALELESWGCWDLAEGVRKGLIDCHAVTILN